MSQVHITLSYPEQNLKK